MEIKLKNVDYTIEKVNYQPKEIYKNLNVSFSCSMIHGIVGQCGSGKTILLELIAGLRKPISGTVDIPYQNIQKNVGYVKELENIEIFSTVMEWMQNSIYYYKKMSMTDMTLRMIDSLKMVGLDGTYLKRKVERLSEGEIRKISLAIGLFHNPKILILDDPFRFLDMKSKNDLCKFLRMLKNRYKKTIILSTNDMDMLQKVVDNVYILFEGKIVTFGNKNDVFKDDKLLKKYGVSLPKCIKFSNTVFNKKGIKIGYRDDINDLIKDIYRYAKW